ncbi:hypothetical protein RJ639_001419 [Escallonia herrerae]|uniref:Uncharacterized protein n=1 Tax=Escallonia herrerae TaxID=1293975 RepID=A0AA88X7D3_9ASTE|nr:hypothetical protein RJ639_001419 [Escallonia herrerae]
MEDPNLLAAECIVISCCCQCLTLQILVFILLKLPYNIVRRTKKFVKKKLGKRKREGKIIQSDTSRIVNEAIRSHSGSFRIQLDGSSVNKCDGFACCMEEAEKVLKELSEKAMYKVAFNHVISLPMLMDLGGSDAKDGTNKYREQPFQNASDNLEYRMAGHTAHCWTYTCWTALAVNSPEWNWRQRDP